VKSRDCDEYPRGDKSTAYGREESVTKKWGVVDQHRGARLESGQWGESLGPMQLSADNIRAGIGRMSGHSTRKKRKVHRIEYEAKSRSEMKKEHSKNRTEKGDGEKGE